MEPKRVMSSLDIAAATLELAPLVTGKHVDNIYQIGEKTFLFKLRPEQLTLLIEVGRRIHTTQYELAIPRSPPQFCMALRKRLRNARLTSIRQHEFERIVLLGFERGGDKCVLVAEFFPRGNLILVDNEGKIDLSLWRARMRDRDIVKGEHYTHAPSYGFNPLTITIDELRQLKDMRGSNMSKALTGILSSGGAFSKEILLLSGVEDTDASQVDAATIGDILDAIQKLEGKLNLTHFDPRVLLNSSGNVIDISPFTMKIHEGLQAKPCRSFNLAVDEYFARLQHKKEVAAQKEVLSREAERLQRTLEAQEKQLRDLKDAIEINQKRGKLLLAHLHQTTTLLANIVDQRRNGASLSDIISQSQGWPDTSSSLMLRSIDGAKGTAHLLIDGAEIELQLNRRPQDQANLYFDRSKDARRKLSGTLRAIQNTRRALNRLQEDAQIKASEPKTRPRRTRRWYDKFFHFKSSEGFLVLIGRDASSNETLIKRYADPSDLVFHAEIHGAPFVVVKTKGKALGEPTIREAAQAAVSYSSAWRSGLSSADAYYVQRNQVTKEAPSGEYLTKGAFMMSGRRNYVKGVETILAVGLIRRNGNVDLVAGPPHAIEQNAEWHMVIAPGSTQSLKLAKLIVHEVSQAGLLPRDGRELGVEHVMRVLPRGGSSVVRSLQKAQIDWQGTEHH